MKDTSTRKYEIWECDSIIEQHQKEYELNRKYRWTTVDIKSDDSTCLRMVKARRTKQNYKNKEDFIKEVVETKKVALGMNGKPIRTDLPKPTFNLAKAFDNYWRKKGLIK